MKKNYSNKKFLENAKKIRVAIIGLGKIAWINETDLFIKKRIDYPTHFSVLRDHGGFQLVAVQDVNIKTMRLFCSWAKKFGQEPQKYTNWEEMIIKEKPDLLVVASNTESHFEICKRVIDLGVKNILCEKPLSYSPEEAKILSKKAERKKCILFVNYFRAFNNSYIGLIKKIKEGFLGKIQSFDVRYSRGIFNNGTHAIDVLIRMFGEIKIINGFKNHTCHVSKKDPTVNAFLEFKNGVSGYIHGLNNDFYDSYDFAIIGEFGIVNIIFDKAQLYVRDKSNIAKGYKGLKIKFKSNLIDVKEGLYPVYENIYCCMRQGRKNKCSGYDSLKSLLVADKIIKSIKK